MSGERPQFGQQRMSRRELLRAGAGTLVFAGIVGAIAELIAFHAETTKMTVGDILKLTSVQKDQLIGDSTYIGLNNVAVLPIRSAHYEKVSSCGATGCEFDERTMVTMDIFSPVPVGPPNGVLTGFEDKFFPFSDNQDPGVPEESNPQGMEDPHKIHQYNVRGWMRNNSKNNTFQYDTNLPEGYYFEVDQADRVG
jgi:hypothetical protein